MERVADLGNAELSYRFYGGRAGQKIGILIDGEPWIAKYPRSGRDLVGRHVPGHASSPVAEWLGSHIYSSVGIPAHETMLGWHGGKVVCACRDFCVDGAQLVEFNRLKNTLSDDEEDFVGSPSDGEVTWLQDVLSSLSLVELLRTTPGVVDRFWDMFVMDAFIKNPDLAAAVVRAASNIDPVAIDALIDAVPEEAYGRILMTPDQRTSHKRLLRLRLEQGIIPAADRARDEGLA